MTRLQRLESRKAALVAQVSEISTAAEADGQRPLSTEERTKADNSLGEITSTEFAECEPTRRVSGTGSSRPRDAGRDDSGHMPTLAASHGIPWRQSRRAGLPLRPVD